MFRLTKPTLTTSLSTIIFIETTALIGFAYIFNMVRNDANRYAEAIVYYDSIFEREDVQLTDYDLIALSTLFEPETQGMEE